MKKIITIITCMVAFISTSKAQFFVGGNVNWAKESESFEKISKDSNKKPSKSTFGFAPKIGYYANERLSLGLEFLYNMSNSVTKIDDYKNKSQSSEWLISPFVRYEICKFGKIALIGEGGFGFGQASGFTKIDDVKEKDPRKNLFEIRLAPVIEMELTPAISIEAKINLAGLEYVHTSYKEDDLKYKKNNFGLGLNNETVLSTLSVGAIYKF